MPFAKRRAVFFGCGAAAALILAASIATAAERPYRMTEEREACARYEPLRQPWFGDTHVHTSFSMDAGTRGTRNTPRDAHRFAKGERVGVQPYDSAGDPMRTVQLERPLDWTLVSDHAEMLGEVRICDSTDLPGSDSDICWNRRNLGVPAFIGFISRTMGAKQRFRFCGPDGRYCRDAAIAAWREIRDAAEEAYDRSAACTFTSFVGYEWTAMLVQGENLHRNVLFRNHVAPEYALSWVETPSAWHLWQGLERDCSRGLENCEFLTIPHNSNLSGDGLMFATAKLRTSADRDAAVDADEARLRQRYEPLVEVMQHKGDSECLPGGETPDEACGFEKVPYDSMLGAGGFAGSSGFPAPKRTAYVREALKRGLELEARLGINPLKYGLLASTDTHLGTPGRVREKDWLGHRGVGPSMAAGIPPGLPERIEFNPGGLAVAWAEENSRDSLFAALERREVYGTSGPRHVVRLFGGWDYDPGLCDSPELAAHGYRGGVPMGGDLPARPPEATTPTLAVAALSDPGTEASPGTPLERIQIVKGWVADGEAHERVFEVAGSKSPGNVDPSTCRTDSEGEAGAQRLCTVWRDPEFDAGQHAFYYARVLESPTCRWHQQLCVAASVDCSDPESVGRGFEPCCDERYPKTVRERSWTSPIWYRPDAPPGP